MRNNGTQARVSLALFGTHADIDFGFMVAGGLRPPSGAGASSALASGRDGSSV